MPKYLKLDNGNIVETTSMAKVLALGNSGIEEVNAGGWAPHPDWIDISQVNNNEINLLVSDGSTGVAFAVTVAGSGTYSIDWGDGNVEHSRASGVTYYHGYVFGTGQSVNGGEYTVFKIRIYNATNTITRFQVTKHPEYSRPHSSPLLWAVFGTAGITNYSYTFWSSMVECSSLQSCTIASFASCTDVQYMFFNCRSLASVTLPSSWGNVTNTSNMFYNCTSLVSVTLPGSWGNVTGVNSMFSRCYSLKNITNLQYLGSQTYQASFGYFMFNTQAFSGIVTVASMLSKISVCGESGHNIKVTGVRLTNATGDWGGSSPQIDVSYCSMDATALNTLFGDLNSVTGRTIKITGNPGSATCNTAIATSKGWTVVN